MVNFAIPALRAFLLALIASAFLGGCATGYKSDFDAPNGKVLLVSRKDWADFQKYLGKIGSTRDGAFAMGVYKGHSDGWAQTWCSYDACYGGNSATQVMRTCRNGGGECVLFASDDKTLVNYKVEE